MRTSTRERREQRQRRADERRRREVTATLHRLGVRYCSYSCGRYADDLWVQPDGQAVPMAYRCAEAARRSVEAVPA
jgi:hypothetical protein